MQALKAADAGKGQRLFLRGMIKHHKGAIAMVQEEIDNGENPRRRQARSRYQRRLSAQIKTMETLLARLDSSVAPALRIILIRRTEAKTPQPMGQLAGAHGHNNQPDEPPCCSRTTRRTSPEHPDHVGRNAQ